MLFRSPRELENLRKEIQIPLSSYLGSGSSFDENMLQHPITPQVLAKRTLEYRGWVEGYARNHKIPVLKAEKGVSNENSVRPHLQRMERRNQHGVYCIFTSIEMA